MKIDVCHILQNIKKKYQNPQTTKFHPKNHDVSEQNIAPSRPSTQQFIAPTPPQHSTQQPTNPPNPSNRPPTTPKSKHPTLVIVKNTLCIRRLGKDGSDYYYTEFELDDINDRVQYRYDKNNKRIKKKLQQFVNLKKLENNVGKNKSNNVIKSENRKTSNKKVKFSSKQDTLLEYGKWDCNACSFINDDDVEQELELIIVVKL